MSAVAALAAPIPVSNNPLDLSMSMAFGSSQSDNAPRARSLSLGEFIAETSHVDTARCKWSSAEYHNLRKDDPHENAQRSRAKNGPYFIPARFARSDTRKAADVLDLCGFVLDFDSGFTKIEDVSSVLEGTFHVTYTTFSHRPDTPRLRTFIPYASPIPPALHVPVYEHYCERFHGHAFDTRSKTTNQLWFLPACPYDAAGEFRQVVGQGQLFNPLTEIALLPPRRSSPPRSASPPPIPASATDDIQTALPHIKSDDRDTWIRVGMALKHELGEAGRSTWTDWSRTSVKFDEEECDKAWTSFQNDTTKPVTIASVFYLAKKNGWASVSTRALDAEIEILNETYFFATLGGKAFVHEERVNPSTGLFEVVPMNKADFIACFANRKYPNGTRANAATISVGNAWFNSPRRRAYDGIVFSPSPVSDRYYNLWRGFGVDPAPGTWDKFKAHIRDVICDGDGALYEYILGWLAHAVQKTDELPGVALVLRGGRGTGKGTFAKWIGKLFGSHFLQVAQARHIVGNFNAHLRECLLLFADEAFWAGDKQGESTLKALITEPTLAIERKGVDVESTRNFLRVVMASNSDWVIPAGHDERRFCVMDVSDAHAQDGPYFAAIEEQMLAGGAEAMLFELQRHDISKFNVRLVPRTRALTEQKLLSMHPIDDWWFHKLQSGFIAGQKQWEVVGTSDLFNDYMVNLSSSQGLSRRATETQLGIRMKRLVPSIARRRSSGAKGHRTSTFVLPPLAECRALFEKHMKTEFDWGED